MSPYDDLLSAITADVDEDRNGAGVVVTSFVVIGSFIDAEGDRHIYSNTMDGQRCHETLGLLAFAQAVEADHAVGQRSLGDDDG